MTNHEIVALRCPACNGGITQPTREMPFGAEFRCEICGITSVLIINQALVPLSSLQKQGEKVCIICGRVALREAQFCQEGHALTKQCLNCSHGIAVDHQRCDFCGWEQTVKPFTDEGKSLAFERAISEIANPSWKWNTIQYSLKAIIEEGNKVSVSHAEKAALAIHNLMMDSTFRQRSLVSDDDDSVFPGANRTEELCWEALGSLGPPTLPIILSIINNSTFCRSINNKKGQDFTDEWSLKALANMGTLGLPAILNLIRKPSFALHWCIVAENSTLFETLRQLGSSAHIQIAPILLGHLEGSWTSRWSNNPAGTNWKWLFNCLVTVSPKDALSICSRSLEVWDKNSQEVNRDTLRAASSIGKDAIPMLEKFCGFFSGRRGKVCAKVISELREGKSDVYVSSWDC